MKYFLLVLLLLFQTLGFAGAWESLGKIPVQDSGRIKPFDSFARETMQLVYGKQTYKTSEKKRNAIEVVYTWMLLPQVWAEKEILQIRFHEVKKALGLKVEKTYFAPAEILRNQRLQALLQELREQIEAEERLSPYFQALQRLQNQMSVFRAVGQRMLPLWYPQPEGKAWLSYENMPEEIRVKFDAIAAGFIKDLHQPDVPNLKQAIKTYMDSIKPENQSYDLKKINTEVHYNSLHPFQKAWILYLLAGLFAVLYIGNKKPWAYKGLWASMLLGLLFHTYGFALRVYLTERAPVSNMYETVIWVSWGSILIAMCLQCIKRSKYLLLSANIGSVLCLILADMAPVVLDPSLQPLQAVLRSNYWLVVHVLTITLSYAAFFVAFCLGDIGLFYFLLDAKKYKTDIQEICTTIYKSIQIGVVLLAAGTILGGIWADESWGRFWGWDPKETWALIALLGYVAVLHGRLAGFIRQLGMVVSAVLVFSLVIMAWYGVNFVLGAGLHSYGFGGGGIEFVSAFVGLHILYVVFVVVSHKTKNKRNTA